VFCHGLSSTDIFAKTIDATDLVDGIASNGREAQLLNELLPAVLDVALGSTDLQGLLLGSLEVLLLANIGHEADDLVALILSDGVSKCRVC
jgi:hypothetical protein